MMVVMVMWCTLNVVMVVYWLTWAVLWEIILSSVEWSGGIRMRYVFIRFLVMMVMVMMTNLLAHTTASLVYMHLLVMWWMVMVMPGELAPLSSTDSRRSPSVIAFGVEDILVLDSLWFPALL
jgi:hypothetical protein